MSISTVGVVGLGLLGRGICACLLGRGLRVVGLAPNTTELDRARRVIAEAFAEMVAHGVCEPATAEEWEARYHGTMSCDDLANCDFVIESVTEDLAVKQSVLAEIEAIVGSHVPIATNTSAIPIRQLQQDRRHPERILGMHWMEPAYATRFLELIRGEQTGDEAFQLAEELAESCGKEPCRVNKDVPGFIVNRLGYAIYREALHMIEEGVADAETIDRAFRNVVGVWSPFCGPLRWIDLTGGPALYAKAMTPVLPTLSNATEVPAKLRELAASAPDGIQGGKGFYTYSESQAELWERRLREHAWKMFELDFPEQPQEEAS